MNVRFVVDKLWRVYFFLIGIHAMQGSAQPLRGMELQEKQVQKD